MVMDQNNAINTSALENGLRFSEDNPTATFTFSFFTLEVFTHRERIPHANNLPDFKLIEVYETVHGECWQSKTRQLFFRFAGKKV